MPDFGGLEGRLIWASSSDDLTTSQPGMEIVAVPIDEDAEGLFVKGGHIYLKVDRGKVQDVDLDKAVEGACTGFITVYPGYISKKMEPPKENVRTYFIDWCSFYRTENDYLLALRYTRFVLGSNPDFEWGKF